MICSRSRKKVNGRRGIGDNQLARIGGSSGRGGVFQPHLFKMTTFKSALAICGLSQVEATRFFDVGLQTVKHWSSARNNPPQGVWIMLADLFEQIQDAADFAADHMAVEGVDPRAWGNIEADLGQDSLPHGAKIAGAMALLMTIKATE